MTCSVVGSDVRLLIKNGILDFDAVILFTEEPPIGEDFFTVVSRKDVLNMPVGVKPDLRLSNEARLKPHVLQFRSGKGRTPALSTSYVFSRVERGKQLFS